MAEHLLGKWMCQVVDQESQMSELVIYEGLEMNGKLAKQLLKVVGCQVMV